jgi:hypothetical protein
MIVPGDEPGDITAPQNIIQTVPGARAIYYQYRQEHLSRIQLYSEIEGLIAGNPPYNPIDLAQHKLSHLANFNNLDARALYERAALAYWNLLNEAQYIAKFEIDIDAPESIDIADTLARNFNAVVREWPSFNVVFNTLAGQLVRFGISPVLWPDERDWRWRTIELSRFFVEDQAQSDIEQVTRIFVESIFTVQYLYEVYSTFEHLLTKAQKSDGTWDYTVCPWNLIELSKLLLYKANSAAKTDYNDLIIDMMDLQRRVQNRDLTLNAIFSDDLRIVTMLSKEYDGKISHYMFERIYDSGSFLYFVDRQYKCMQEGLVIFTASPGEFTIHSNRGLGHKIFSGAQAMMQLDCSIVDMSRMAATPLLQSMSTGSKDFETIRIYPGVATNIGTAEFVDNKMGANISQLIGASQFILQKLQFNTANSGDDPAYPDRDQGSLSAPQARMKAYKEFSVLKNNIAHFYNLFDSVIKNMVIKMWRSKKGYPGYEYAKAWKDKCIKDGVPEDFFSYTDDGLYGMPEGVKVSATRVVGDGSQAAKIMGLEALMPIVGDFGPRESREYKKQWIMATMGAEYVPAFLQDSDDADESAGGASLAAVENAIMQSGMSPVFSPDNDQKAHFVTHLALGNDTIRKIKQQQLSTVEADKTFTVLLPHMQEHFQALARSPFAISFMGKIQKPWKELQDYAILNRKNAQRELQAAIKKQQEQQAAQEQVLNDEQLKNLKAKGDEERANFKVQSQVERAKEANATRAEVMREKVNLDAGNSRLKVNLEAQNQTLKAQQEAVETKPLESLRGDLEAISGGLAEPPV